MSTQQILGAVGAVVGAYFGNPQLGYAIGSAIGGAIDPEVIKGPKIGDIAKPTSMEGVPRPIIWALSPPMGGNIIAASEPKIVRKRTRQGKGGPKVESEHVYRTYAIGVCEGPISRFVRVWRNTTLVYDVSEFPQLTDEDNVNFLKTAHFFLGTYEQEPSPHLEIVFGFGATPAHRGTAYMVMNNEELTDLRGAIPQYMFQVERCEGSYVTSRPYPLNQIDAIDVDFGVRPGPSPFLIEAIENSFDLVSGDLNQILLSYPDGEPEALETTDFELISVFTSETTFSEYEDGDPEAVEITGFELVSGELDEALIGYDDALPEAVESAFSIVSGELT